MTVPSIRQLAAALGVSHTILNRHLRAGKLNALPGGGFDVDQVRSALKLNVDQANSRSTLKDSPAPVQVQQVSPSLPPGEIQPPQKGTLAYEQWRLTREKADREALERQRLDDQLLDARDVAAAWSAKISEASRILLAIGDELGDKLAAEVDAVRCREMVNARVRAAMQELADAA